MLLTDNRLLIEQIWQQSLFMVKDTKQNNICYFNIAIIKVKKDPCKLLRKIKWTPHAKENHCTGRWLLNGFLSHEMLEKRVSRRDAELIFITNLTNKISTSHFYYTP